MRVHHGRVYNPSYDSEKQRGSYNWACCHQEQWLCDILPRGNMLVGFWRMKKNLIYIYAYIPHICNRVSEEESSVDTDRCLYLHRYVIMLARHLLVKKQCTKRGWFFRIQSFILGTPDFKIYLVTSTVVPPIHLVHGRVATFS